MDKKLEYLNKYGYIYHMVGMTPITKSELREKFKNGEEKLSSTTLTKYVDAPFTGDFPFFLVDDGKAMLDVGALRSSVKELCGYVGVELEELLDDGDQKGGTATEDAGKGASKVESLKKELRKEQEKNARLKKEMTELKKHLAELTPQVLTLQADNLKQRAGNILSSMDKTVDLSTVCVLGKGVEEDIFLHTPEQVLGQPKAISRTGGRRPSFYDEDEEKAHDLTMENGISKFRRFIFNSKILEKFYQDTSIYEMKLSGKKRVSLEEMEANRQETIKLLLEDNTISNQTKLSLYAIWYKHKGTEVGDILDYAGNYGLDANYVIKILESPYTQKTYHNLRDFLRQACKGSEVKIKREAAKELIAGEWYALADYNGVPCRFQMFPVEEMLLFRKYLSDGLYSEALKIIDKLLGTDRKAEFVKGDAEREILVQSGPYQNPEEKFYIEASKMIHQYDALVSGDAGSGADENASLDGLSEDEEEVQ